MRLSPRMRSVWGDRRGMPSCSGGVCTFGRVKCPRIAYGPLGAGDHAIDSRSLFQKSTTQGRSREPAQRQSLHCYLWCFVTKRRRADAARTFLRHAYIAVRPGFIRSQADSNRQRSARFHALPKGIGFSLPIRNDHTSFDPQDCRVSDPVGRIVGEPSARGRLLFQDAVEKRRRDALHVRDMTYIERPYSAARSPTALPAGSFGICPGVVGLGSIIFILCQSQFQRRTAARPCARPFAFPVGRLRLVTGTRRAFGRTFAPRDHSRSGEHGVRPARKDEEIFFAGR